MFLAALGHPNLALGKSTWQIDVYGNAVPSRAVDGNKAAGWDSNSCTHTESHQNAWWAVDLYETHTINTVVVTNRLEVRTYGVLKDEYLMKNELTHSGLVVPLGVFYHAHH